MGRYVCLGNYRGFQVGSRIEPFDGDVVVGGGFDGL